MSVSLVAKLGSRERLDDLAIAMCPPRPSDVLSKLEQRFYDVFAEKGPVLARDVLERELLGSGVNYASFYAYLSYCPIITRVDTGIYALVGAPISPGVIDDLAVRRTPKKTVLGRGWCRGGEIWLAYELTYGTIGSGSFGIPSALKDLLQGTYTLRSEDGGEFGTATGRETFLYGFSKFFRRRGAEPGECLVMVVDLQSKTVIARIGDAGLVESYERGVTAPDRGQLLEPELECGEHDPLVPDANEVRRNLGPQEDTGETTEQLASLQRLGRRIASVFADSIPQIPKAGDPGRYPRVRWRGLRGG